MSKRIPKMVDTATIEEQFGVTRFTLCRQVQQGILKQGLHFIVISGPNAKRPAYRWDPQALWELWAKDPAQRP
ncbi:MAG: hypothetical protein HC924_16520 [Synechococcaceae cyanobacterium SM2_3_2]|nr:hypothetical protein [Synechococcaceae cyanobacterium SM2_3_2]